MGSLYIRKSYGYVFRPGGEEKEKFNAWYKSEDSDSIVDQYYENNEDHAAGENRAPALTFINDENGRNFYFSAPDGRLGGIFGYATFQMGDISPSESVVDAVEREFEAMLLDAKVPEILRVRESWELAGTLFHVTT